MLHRNSKIELSPRLKFAVGRGYSPNKILKISAYICLVLAVSLAANAIRIIITGSGNDESAIPAQVLGASDTKTQNETAVNFIEYKIQNGDTLFNISQKFNINWTTIASINNLSSPFSIKPGQILKIPQTK
jgi:LysM repeat protein